MTTKARRILATVVISALLVTAAESSRAQAHPQAALDSPGSNAKTEVIGAVIASLVAATVLGIYFSTRHGHSATGCVANGANGLELRTQEGQSYVLLSATAGIKAGDRIKVSGSKKKKVDAVTDRPSLIVFQLEKDYGVCAVQPAGP